MKERIKMEIDIDVPSDLKIMSLTKILGGYESWKSTIRDLKIYSLLDRKVEISIRDVNIRGTLDPENPKESQMWDTAFVIKSLFLTLSNNLSVISMRCEIRTITSTRLGSVLNQLMEHLPKSLEMKLIMDSNDVIGFNIQVTRTQTQ